MPGGPQDSESLSTGNDAALGHPTGEKRHWQSRGDLVSDWGKPSRELFGLHLPQSVTPAPPRHRLSAERIFVGWGAGQSRSHIRACWTRPHHAAGSSNPCSVCHRPGWVIWHQAVCDLLRPGVITPCICIGMAAAPLGTGTRPAGTVLRPNPLGSSRLRGGGGGSASVPTEEVPPPGPVRGKRRHCTEAETKPCLWRWGRGCALGRTPGESKQAAKGPAGHRPRCHGWSCAGEGAGLAPLLSILHTACW